jgi:phosphatidylglycerol---prolipoprotein diacylglyceryl transferase
MIHNFDPILLTIGPLPIRWYSLAYIAGIVLGLVYIKFLAKKAKLDFPPQFLDNLFCVCIIGIIVGGRLGHVLFYNPLEYFQNPIEILKTWHGGLSFHGGLIGSIFAIILVSKHYKVDYWKLLDLAACAGPIGIFFGRMANFINGELFGKSTNISWGVIFSNTGGGSIARHPTQIYEALTEGLLLFMLLNFFLFEYKLYKKPRMLSALFCIFYSLFRFGIEFLKEPDLSFGYIFEYFTMGQVLSALLLLVGLIIARVALITNK